MSVTMFEILLRLSGCENLSGPSRNGPPERVCIVAPDGTDSKKTNKWGCSWNAFGRMSLKMTKRILWSQCSLAGPFLKSFIWSGSAARKSRLISVLTFGNENGGVAKGIEFTGSAARQSYWVLERTRKVYSYFKKGCSCDPWCVMHGPCFIARGALT